MQTSIIYKFNLISARGGGALLVLLYSLYIFREYEESVANEFFYVFSLATVISTLIKYGVENWLLVNFPKIADRSNLRARIEGRLLFNLGFLSIISSTVVIYLNETVWIEYYAILLGLTLSGYSTLCTVYQAKSKVLLSILLRNILPQLFFLILILLIEVNSVNELLKFFVIPYILLLFLFLIMGRRIIFFKIMSMKEVYRAVGRQHGYAVNSFSDALFSNFTVILIFLSGFSEYTSTYAIASRFARVIRLLASTVTTYATQDRTREFLIIGHDLFVNSILKTSIQLFIFNMLAAMICMIVIYGLNLYEVVVMDFNLVNVSIFIFIIFSEAIYSVYLSLLNFFLVTNNVNKISLALLSLILILGGGALLTNNAVSISVSAFLISIVCCIYCAVLISMGVRKNAS
jgi:hypothetical protein